MAEPPQGFTIHDIREAGTEKLGWQWTQYINEGTVDLVALKANEAAYDRYHIMPRILRDVEPVDTSTTIFGVQGTMPFGFSPAAMHCLAHPDGEIATSRAAAKAGIAMGLSHWSTKPLEDVIDAGNQIGNGNPYGIQTSGATLKAHTLELTQRSVEAGYKTVLVTVDTPTIGRRLNE